MPTTDNTKAPKIHPGRNAGDGPTRDDRPEPEAPAPTRPATAELGEARRQDAEHALYALLSLGHARIDLDQGLSQPNDILDGDRRTRAVGDLERIIADLAGGLALAKESGRVAIVVESRGVQLRQAV